MLKEKVKESSRRLRVNRPGKYGMTVRQYESPIEVNDYEFKDQNSNVTANIIPGERRQQQAPWAKALTNLVPTTNFSCFDFKLTKYIPD